MYIFDRGRPTLRFDSEPPAKWIGPDFFLQYARRTHARISSNWHARSHERSGIAAATGCCCCCCAAAASAGWLLRVLLLAAAATRCWQPPQNFEWKIPREFLYENPYLNFLRKLYLENTIKKISLGKWYQKYFSFF